MKEREKINILMISSSSTLGGGAKHMFMLGGNLNNDFNVFYAIPKNNNFKNANFGNKKKVFVKKEFIKNENLENKINKFLKLIAYDIQKSQQEKDEF